jgi:hypothetical protein
VGSKSAWDLLSKATMAPAPAFLLLILQAAFWLGIPFQALSCDEMNFGGPKITALWGYSGLDLVHFPNGLQTLVPSERGDSAVGAEKMKGVPVALQNGFDLESFSAGRDGRIHNTVTKNFVHGGKTRVFGRYEVSMRESKVDFFVIDYFINDFKDGVPAERRIFVQIKMGNLDPMDDRFEIHFEYNMKGGPPLLSNQDQIHFYFDPMGNLKKAVASKNSLGPPNPYFTGTEAEGILPQVYDQQLVYSGDSAQSKTLLKAALGKEIGVSPQHRLQGVIDKLLASLRDNRVADIRDL